MGPTASGDAGGAPSPSGGEPNGWRAGGGAYRVLSEVVGLGVDAPVAGITWVGCPSEDRAGASGDSSAGGSDDRRAGGSEDSAGLSFRGGSGRGCTGIRVVASSGFPAGPYSQS